MKAKKVFLLFWRKKSNSKVTSTDYETVFDRFGINVYSMWTFFISIVLYMYCLIWEPVSGFCIATTL